MRPQTQHCIDRLQKCVDQLRHEGIGPLYIAAALAEVTVVTAEKDSDTAMVVLDSVAAIVAAAAEARRGRAIMQALHEELKNGSKASIRTKFLNRLVCVQI